MTKFQMRGNSILVNPLRREPQKVKGIQLSGPLDREIDHAIVLAVGPGLIAAAGGRPDTHDLKEGQYVLVHACMIRKPSPQAPEQIVEKYVPVVVGNETYKIVDQSQIIAILEWEVPT